MAALSDVGQVEIVELNFDTTTAAEGGDAIGITGQLTNQSEGTVVMLTIALTFHDCPDGYSAELTECSPYDAVFVDAVAEVPPGESGAFTASMPLDGVPPAEGTLEILYHVDAVEIQ